MIKLFFLFFIHINLIATYQVTKRNHTIFSYFNLGDLSESAFTLRNLCEVRQHNNYQFNSFYKLDLSSTLNPISYYSANCDLKEPFKSKYNDLIREIYSEQFMNQNFFTFFDSSERVRNGMRTLYKQVESDIYQVFNYSLVDPNLIPNWFEISCKSELNQLLDNILKIKDGFLTYELLNSTNLQAILKNYEILKSNPMFNREHLYNFYTEPILSSPKFIYNSEESTDRAVFAFTLFIPVYDQFKIMNLRNCVSAQQLPYFFSNDLKKNRHSKF